jgi:cyclic beta-1,2-glucan synthetase
VVLGECANFYKAKELLSRYNHSMGAHLAFDTAKNWWDNLFSKIQIKTPDPSLDLIFNRWLIYQNLSCRIWGRSAFYQSGGAFGFRDQLQDCAAMVYFDPSITKEQILKCASRQFIEGDVQHWWHEETNSGVRTKISDDLLWMPYVVMHYIRVTGDESIMDIEVPYLEGRLLNEGEHEAIVPTKVSEKKESIKEHCLKAIEKGLTLGPHGLPLIGGGDWNDGMNLVGVKGQGESIWLAWFIIYILKEYSAWFESKQDHVNAANFHTKAEQLLKAIEDHAWDGAWYLRAFFDNGSPIGSHHNVEDKIDSLPQTWAVISGQNNDRVHSAMKSVEEYLIDKMNQLILLFTPPYDNAKENPGYIKGYPPGVRENGGQYTHAAVWVAMAFAKRGEGDKAMHLLRMINPINRTKTLDEIYKYRVEPYVTAADIYALPQQEGRGGWTWYTGSASLMYRTILEDVVGFNIQGNLLRIDPCIPTTWESFSLTYWHGECCYEIQVENPQHISKNVISVEMDGQILPNHQIHLSRLNEKHYIKITMGK